MKKLKLSSLELRRQLTLMTLMIFIPVFCILFLSSYRQHNAAVDSAQKEVLHLIESFEEDELQLVSQTQHLLELLSRVPVIHNLDVPGGNAFLQSIHQYYPQYSTIVVSDPTGIINICALPMDKPVDVSDRSWFQRATESKSFVVDKFIVSRTSKITSRPFAYPVLNSDGSIRFIIGAAFNLSYYEHLFSGHPIPDGSEIILLDDDGVILYSSTDNIAVGNSFSESSGLNIPESGEGRITARDKQGTERYYWYKDVAAGSAGGGIRMIIGLPRNAVLAEVRSSGLQSLLLLISVAVLSISLVGIYGRKMILDPVNRLLEKTRQIKTWSFQQPDSGANFPGELQRLSDEIDLLALALNESQERIRILFDRAADDIYVSDAAGRLIEVNSQAEKDTGYTKSELLRMHVWEIDADQSTGEAIADFFDALIPGQPIKIESRHRKKDGSEYPVEITIVKLDTAGDTMVMGIARNISERMQWQENIQRTLADKEILLKELYHRTKNNMEVIRSMLNLNSNKYDIPEMNEIITSTGNRIEAMALVHQMLYQSEDLSRINLGEYLSKLAGSVVHGLNSGETEINVRIEAEKIDLIIDVAVPLGLVMNEIIMNSCKHAFRGRDGGNILIKASQDETDIHIIFSDDGRGLPEGFEHDPEESLGMTIVNGIIEHQLSGSIALSGKEGVTWSISFPKGIYKGQTINMNDKTKGISA